MVAPVQVFLDVSCSSARARHRAVEQEVVVVVVMMVRGITSEWTIGSTNECNNDSLVDETKRLPRDEAVRTAGEEDATHIDEVSVEWQEESA